MFLHIDIDSFFASAERTLDPSLKGIPMAVGSRSDLEIFNRRRTNIRLMNDNSGAFVTPVFYSSREKSFRSCFIDRIGGREKIRGIITTASYEARKYGVKTGMPIAQALQCCPEMTVVPSNYPLYHELSRKIHRYIASRIPEVEQYSIDEFFGDLNGWVPKEESCRFARTLQMEIEREFDIPVSIGIAEAKWIAKLATGSAKPFNVFMVEDINAYIETIPIRAFPGIGRGFQKRLEVYYISTLGDVRRNKKLFYSWKKPGIRLYHRVTGTDGEGIMQRGERRSIGISRTFDPLYESAEVKRRIMIMARHIVYMVMAIEADPATYYLKVNYEGGLRVRKSVTVDRQFSEKLFKEKLSEIYEGIACPAQGAVKLTLNVSNFGTGRYKTLSLLDLHEDRRACALGKKIHLLRERFGLDIVRTADEL